MECNKYEAAKAKELAEKKFQERDIAGAKKLAQKAKNLFPSLDGLPEFLAALGIYIAADSKINGQVDWYGVLGVDPSADEDTMRKHYRKLALALHPDKNKSVGADGAFQILSQAWSLLSDKGKRMAYDQKRNPGGIYQKVTFVSQPRAAGGNGFCAPANNFTSNMRNQENVSSRYSAAPHNRSLRSESFWTACTSCWTQYEYLKVFLDRILICPNCKNQFLAIQMAPPPNLAHQTRSSHLQQQESDYPGTDSCKHGGDPAVSAAEATHEEAQVKSNKEEEVKGTTHATKRNHDAAGNRSTSSLESERPKKRSSPTGQETNGCVTESSDQMGNQAGVASVMESLQGGIGEAVTVNDHNMAQPSDATDPSLLKTQNRMENTKLESYSKLDEDCKSDALQASNIEAVGMEKEKSSSVAEQIRESAVNGSNSSAGNDPKDKGNKHVASVDTEHQGEPNTVSSTVSVDADYFQVVGSLPPLMGLEDREFHDFDNDRTERCFGDDEVWAAYDDDGMPRRYAVVHGVISRKPFRMRMSWLNCKGNTEFSRAIKWVGCGFSKTSGEFRTGKKETMKSIDDFSHKVNWSKGTTGAVQIYPQKGDVWALYRNWSPEWNQLTPRELIHKYDMVEVLEDYDVKKGVTIVLLVKVAGLKTVFRRHSDPQQVRVIPREEMFRFSHQVPSYGLSGEESSKALAGCRELDPAAIPSELLK